MIGLKEKEVEVKEETYREFVLYNIKKSYIDAFYQLMRKHKGGSGAWAFEQLIEHYALSHTLGQLSSKIDDLEQRLSEVEGKSERTVKTFRGEVK